MIIIAIEEGVSKISFRGASRNWEVDFVVIQL